MILTQGVGIYSAALKQSALDQAGINAMVGSTTLLVSETAARNRLYRL